MQRSAEFLPFTVYKLQIGKVSHAWCWLGPLALANYSAKEAPALLCQAMYIADAIHGTFVHNEGWGGGRFFPNQTAALKALTIPACLHLVNSAYNWGKDRERGRGVKSLRSSQKQRCATVSGYKKNPVLKIYPLQRISALLRNCSQDQ
ncbi:UNVERIFIED_CONTAM: hypothetical protein K2H54_043213 [Gekko kuhli]